MKVSSFELGLWVAAGVLFTVVVLLGRAVAQRTPTRIDVEAIALRGQSPALARVFTYLGRWPALVGIAALAALGAFVLRSNVAAIGILLLVQGFTQAVTYGAKILFRRTRPEYWIAIQEKDLSFPSGHGVSSIVFFVGLALMVGATTTIPRPLAAPIVAVLSVCAIGIPWSRLALGAHYLTDVVGGLLFGSAWLCVAAALVQRFGLFNAARIHG